MAEPQPLPPHAQIVLAPSRPATTHATTVFVAGTTKGPDWRAAVKAALAAQPVTIFDPLRPDWDDSWREDPDFAPFREQVQWELDMQERADVIVLYFHPAAEAPISLLELGLCARRGRDRVVVACPEGYWKRGNVVLVCESFGIEVVGDLDSLVAAVVGLVNDHVGRVRE